VAVKNFDGMFSRFDTKPKRTSFTDWMSLRGLSTNLVLQCTGVCRAGSMPRYVA